ncbi:hypothetical protein [Paenibacillus pabuli]|uniref:hypothetical protein n=1 Tax=Paenibacillus pabuli TaxID=1472 RepID=UPI00200041C5|nr:hypothetical protein [Paenibacillus pabuli]UPK43209.1 hypothetical protein KET34_29585 [Paenibacillus pabuli]
MTIKTDWSSNSEIAAVYACTITAKKEGTAVITATYQGKTVIVNVSVSKKVKALTRDVNDFDLRVGKEQQVDRYLRGWIQRECNEEGSVVCR